MTDTKIPCKAKDPNTCKFHGAQLRAEAALNRGDLNTWMRETEAMIANSSIDEVQEFATENQRWAGVLTGEQLTELPVWSETVDSDGNEWRKTRSGGWQRINDDGSLQPESRVSRWFAKENKPTLKSMPEGTAPTPTRQYQPGYPKQLSWQELREGDQISGGTVISVLQTTETKRVNVTLLTPDGNTKTFAATKYNKQTVVGNANAA